MVTLHGWQVDLTGFVQADWVAHAQDSSDEVSPDGQTLNQERFFVRSARLRAEAHHDGLFGALEFDGNTITGRATAGLLSAYAGWRYVPPHAALPVLSVQAGLFKTPFGVEIPTGERYRAFLEPATFALALVPGGYDAGVMMQGAYGIARWAVAAMNGAPTLDAQWHGVDPSASHDLVGRIGADIAGPRNLRVEVGFSGLAGQGLYPGTPATKDELQWVDENMDGLVQTPELQVVPGQAGTPSQTFDRSALGADLQVHWCLCVLGNGTAFAEGVLATNLDRGLVYADPVGPMGTSRDFRELGFAVGVVQDVGRYAQAGVRYDRYDGDRDVVEQLGVTVVGEHRVYSTLSFMLTARWGEARLMAQYDHAQNPFGRADDGAPITREADRLTFRAQVGF